MALCSDFCLQLLKKKIKIKMRNRERDGTAEIDNRINSHANSHDVISCRGSFNGSRCKINLNAIN